MHLYIICLQSSTGKTQVKSNTSTPTKAATPAKSGSAAAKNASTPAKSGTPAKSTTPAAKPGKKFSSKKFTVIMLFVSVYSCTLLSLISLGPRRIFPFIQDFEAKYIALPEIHAIV